MKILNIFFLTHFLNQPFFHPKKKKNFQNKIPLFKFCHQNKNHGIFKLKTPFLKKENP